MTETRLVPLKKIKDNPWRDRVRNPIDVERVEAIATSINKTSKYWLGTYGREVTDGFVELAFGHHRLEAAKAQGLKEIPITIEKFTDGEMLVWMAQENVRGELPVVIEAVAAAVKALGEGKVKIEAPEPNTRKDALRYAPSFISGKTTDPTVGSVPYTAKTLAAYLGYIKRSTGAAKDSVQAALGILERAEIAGAEGGDTGKKKAKAMEDSLAKLKVNEAVKVISDIKQREDTVRQRQEKTAEEMKEFDRQQREIQAKRKQAEQEAEAARRKLTMDLAKAEIKEDKPKIEAIKAKIAEKEERAVEKALDLEVRAAELEKKVEARKAAESAKKVEDQYLPIKREVERILHKLEGETATTKEALASETKALSRLPINPTDRERLRQAALNYGTWFCDWVAQQFIPPFGPSKKLAEYHQREAQNRRAAEVKAERLRLKEEKKRAKAKKR